MVHLLQIRTRCEIVKERKIRINIGMKAKTVKINSVQGKRFYVLLSQCFQKQISTPKWVITQYFLLRKEISIIVIIHVIIHVTL